MLEERGFYLKPSSADTLFGLYHDEQHVLLTADLLLHAWHRVFDGTVRIVEVEAILPALTNLSVRMMEHSTEQARSSHNPEITKLAEANAAYFAVAAALLDDGFQIPAGLQTMAKTDLERARSSAGIGSSSLLSSTANNDVMIDFTLFLPRGHYSRTEESKRLFRGLMWLSRAPFYLDKRGENPIRQGFLIAQALHGDPVALSSWKNLDEFITFLAGPWDDASPAVFAAILESTLGSMGTPDDLAGDRWSALLEEVKKLPAPIVDSDMTTAMPGSGDQGESRLFTFLGQRISLDEQLIDEVVFPKAGNRFLPSALDLAYALGSDHAGNLPVEPDRGRCLPGECPDVAPGRNEARKLAESWTSDQWRATMAGRWLKAIRGLLKRPKGKVQAFVKHPDWETKQVQSGLASWTEMRHDMIAFIRPHYIVHTVGMTMPPPPPPQWWTYLEPYPDVYHEIGLACRRFEEIITTLGVSDDAILKGVRSLGKDTERFERIARDELAGKWTSVEDHDWVRYWPVKNRWLAEPPKGYEHLYSKADGRMALAVDVAHALGDNGKSVLQEALGDPARIVARARFGDTVVDLEGGAYTHYEFVTHNRPPLTDELWQSLVSATPKPPYVHGLFPGYTNPKIKTVPLESGNWKPLTVGEAFGGSYDYSGPRVAADGSVYMNIKAVTTAYGKPISGDSAQPPEVYYTCVPERSGLYVWERGAETYRRVGAMCADRIYFSPDGSMVAAITGPGLPHYDRSERIMPKKLVVYDYRTGEKLVEHEVTGQCEQVDEKAAEEAAEKLYTRRETGLIVYREDKDAQAIVDRYRECNQMIKMAFINWADERLLIAQLQEHVLVADMDRCQVESTTSPDMITTRNVDNRKVIVKVTMNPENVDNDGYFGSRHPEGVRVVFAKSGDVYWEQEKVETYFDRKKTDEDNGIYFSEELQRGVQVKQVGGRRKLSEWSVLGPNKEVTRVLGTFEGLWPGRMERPGNSRAFSPDRTHMVITQKLDDQHERAMLLDLRDMSVRHLYDSVRREETWWFSRWDGDHDLFLGTSQPAQGGGSPTTWAILYDTDANVARKLFPNSGPGVVVPIGAPRGANYYLFSGGEKILGDLRLGRLGEAFVVDWTRPWFDRSRLEECSVIKPQMTNPSFINPFEGEQVEIPKADPPFPIPTAEPEGEIPIGKPWALTNLLGVGRVVTGAVVSEDERHVYFPFYLHNQEAKFEEYSTDPPDPFIFEECGLARCTLPEGDCVTTQGFYGEFTPDGSGGGWAVRFSPWRSDDPQEVHNVAEYRAETIVRFDENLQPVGDVYQVENPKNEWIYPSGNIHIAPGGLVYQRKLYRNDKGKTTLLPYEEVENALRGIYGDDLCRSFLDAEIVSPPFRVSLGPGFWVAPLPSSFSQGLFCLPDGPPITIRRIDPDDNPGNWLTVQIGDKEPKDLKIHSRTESRSPYIPSSTWISPEGGRLAWTKTNHGRHGEADYEGYVEVYNIKTGTIEQVMQAPRSSLEIIGWTKDPDAIVVHVPLEYDSESKHRSGLIAIDLESRQHFRIPDFHLLFGRGFRSFRGDPMYIITEINDIECIVRLSDRLSDMIGDATTRKPFTRFLPQGWRNHP